MTLDDRMVRVETKLESLETKIDKLIERFDAFCTRQDTEMETMRRDANNTAAALRKETEERARRVMQESDKRYAYRWVEKVVWAVLGALLASGVAGIWWLLLSHGPSIVK